VLVLGTFTDKLLYIETYYEPTFCLGGNRPKISVFGYNWVKIQNFVFGHILVQNDAF